MESKRFEMACAKRSAPAMAGAAVLAVLALGGHVAAHAGDVYWSIGVSSPGVQLGVFSPQPVYVQPQPYYVQPQPYYVQPQPVYTQPQVIYTQPRPVYAQPRPVVVLPQPVYVQPQPVVVYNGWNHPGHRGHGWRHGPQASPQYYPQPQPQAYPQHHPQPHPQQVVEPFPLHYRQ